MHSRRPLAWHEKITALCFTCADQPRLAAAPSSRTASATIWYWNIAQQRDYRSSAQCCWTLRVSVDRAARPSPHTRGKPRLLDVGRRILARDRFAPDSPLEGDGFELPVPRRHPGSWPISTRITRRDRFRKDGVRIRQLRACAALGRKWWARRRPALSVSDPRGRGSKKAGLALIGCCLIRLLRAGPADIEDIIHLKTGGPSVWG